jgi:hypothetical protein
VLGVVCRRFKNLTYDPRWQDAGLWHTEHPYEQQGLWDHVMGVPGVGSAVAVMQSLRPLREGDEGREVVHAVAMHPQVCASARRCVAQARKGPSGRAC